MALDFPSGVVDNYEWLDPSNGVTYIYDISKNSWTAKGGASGAGLQPEDIDTDKGLEIGADGKLGIKTNEAAGIYMDATEGVSGKVYDEYGIQMDTTEGPRIGDNWANIPSL